MVIQIMLHSFFSEVSITKEEEEELLSWEILMRDTYVLSEQQAKSQSMEGLIQDSSQKYSPAESSPSSS